MYLDEIGDTLALEPLIGNEEIKNIGIKKVFHLMTGRNAWHSTWVRQYYKKNAWQLNLGIWNTKQKKSEKQVPPSKLMKSQPCVWS